MSTFINNDITESGRLLLAKAHLGQKLEFTKIVMGDGRLPPDTAVRDMTAVVNPVVNIALTKKVINADGTVIIGGKFSNADIAKEFFYRELALFAKGEDGAEVLYCYGNAGDFAERITPTGGSSVIEKTIDIVTAVGTTKNITANLMKTADAVEIRFDDTKTKLGVENLQEAVEILANTGTVISRDPPEGNNWKLWLQIGDKIPDYPETEQPPEPLTLTLDTAPLDAEGDFAVMYGEGDGETLLNMTFDPDTAKEDDIIVVED